MSACTEWEDKLAELATGEMGEAETRDVESHLKSCAACAGRIEDLRARAARVDAALPMLADGAEISPGFDARLFARIASQGKSRGPAMEWAGWWPRLAAAGVICTMIVAGLAWPPVKRVVRGCWRGEPEVSISTWRSPTESLLQAPGQDLLKGGPKVGEFYFPIQPAANGTNK